LVQPAFFLSKQSMGYVTRKPTLH